MFGGMETALSFGRVPACTTWAMGGSALPKISAPIATAYEVQ